MEKEINDNISVLLEDSDKFMKAIREIEETSISLDSKELVIKLIKKEFRVCNRKVLKLMEAKNRIPLDV